MSFRATLDPQVNCREFHNSTTGLSHLTMNIIKYLALFSIRQVIISRFQKKKNKNKERKIENKCICQNGEMEKIFSTSEVHLLEYKKTSQEISNLNIS